MSPRGRLRKLGVPPGGLVVVGKHEAEQQAALDACYTFMDHVLAMPQTERLFAGWDTTFGVAETVGLLRQLRTQQIHLAETERLRLLGQIGQAINRTLLEQFAQSYTTVALHCPWYWTAKNLAIHYLGHLSFWVLQPPEPVVWVPDPIVLERQPPARGRPYVAQAAHAEWSFRHRVLGAAPVQIAEFDIHSEPRPDLLDERTIWKGIKRVEDLFAHIGYAR